jgi:hypothetical protein
MYGCAEFGRPSSAIRASESCLANTATLAESLEVRQHAILVSQRDGMPQVMHLRFPRVTFYEYYIVQGPNEKNAITQACILPRRFQL